MKSKPMTMQDELWLQSPKPWKPHNYQKEGVKFLLEHAGAMLLADPGLGKTSVTLASLKFLLDKGIAEKVLLIAPLRVCFSVWPKEQTKWSDFKGMKIVVLHGPNKEALLKQEADIYVINPEGLEWLFDAQKIRAPTGKIKMKVNPNRIKELGFDTLIVDELTMFKHIGSQRFKILKQTLGSFKRRWGLTGSPAANSLMDLFGETYIIDQGNALGAFITHFRFKYFEQVDQYVWVPKSGADKEIYNAIAPLALRQAAEDHLDLPELVENPIRLDLPDKAFKIYKALEAELFIKLKGGIVSPSNAGVATNKCRQVASGGVFYDPTLTGLVATKVRDWEQLHDVKTEAVMELVEQLNGNPLLIAYEFEHDLIRLQKALGKDVPYIGGGVSTKRSSELEVAWNRGELPVLLGQPQSMAHGLNLQEVGHHVCWYTLTWDYERYDQLIRRVWRQGQKAKRVFVHQLIARHTIDELVLRALNRKKGGQQALFEALRAAQLMAAA